MHRVAFVLPLLLGSTVLFLSNGAFAEEADDITVDDLTLYEERFSNDEDFDLTDNDYIVDVIAVGVIAFVITLICFCSCLLFLLVEFCKIGGKSRRIQFRGENYERKLLFARVCFVLFFIGTLLAAVFGFLGNEDFDESFDIALSRSEASINSFGTEWSTIRDNIENNIEDAGIEEFNESMSGIEDIARDRRTEVVDANDARGALTIIVFGLGCVICFFFAIISFINNRRYMKFLIPFGFIIGMFAWMIYGIHHPMNRIADDVCFELNDILFGDRPIINSTLTEFLDCPEENVINIAYNATRDGIHFYLDAMADFDSKYETVFRIPEVYSISSLPPDVISEVENDIEVLRERGIEDEPELADEFQAFQDLVSNFPLLVSVFECDAVARYFIQIHDELCYTFIDASLEMERAAIAEAVILSFAMFLCVWSLSFLRKKNAEFDDHEMEHRVSEVPDKMADYRYIEDPKGESLYPDAGSPIGQSVTTDEFRTFDFHRVVSWLHAIGVSQSTISVFGDNNINGEQLLRARSDRLNALVGAEDAQKILNGISGMDAGAGYANPRI